MDTTNHQSRQQDDRGGRQLSEHLNTAPLDAATGGRLVFSSGAIGIALYGEPALAELYRARFVQHLPGVHLERQLADKQASAGPGPCKVTIYYPHRSSADWLSLRRGPLATIALNGSIPWEIEFHGGVANLYADLRGLRLRALDLSDSSAVKVLLPQPAGNVYMYVGGSASDVVIQRPAEVALRVQITGSASQVLLDEHSFGAVANGITWQTLDYHTAADRYDIHFAGSVSNLAVKGA